MNTLPPPIPRPVSCSAQKLLQLCDAIAAGEFDPSFEHQIYRELNSAMRSARLQPQALDPWRPLLYHITEALEALPRARSLVYRGVNLQIDVSQYVTGRHLVWPAFSSTSLDAAVGKQFLGSTASGVLFVIHCRAGVPTIRTSRCGGECQRVAKFANFPSVSAVIDFSKGNWGRSSISGKNGENGTGKKGCYVPFFSHSSPPPPFISHSVFPHATLLLQWGKFICCLM